MTNEERDKIILARHGTSFKGIIKIIKERKTYKKRAARISLLVSALCTGYLLIYHEYSYKIVMAFTGSNLSIFPALCGFSMTSYALSVNIGNLDVFKKSAKLGKTSIYQNSIAIFAYTVFLQLITLAFSYAIKLIDQFPKPEVSYYLGLISNSFFVLILSFFSVYSIVMLFYFIANIFTFGQLNSMFNTMTKFNQEDLPKP